MVSNFSELLSNSENDNNGYLRTSEVEEVLYSLQHCNECLEKISTDIQNWRWVIISLQMALQGAYVCHLSDTSQTGALSNKNTIEWLKWFRDKKGKLPPSYLARFKELHNKTKNNSSGAGRAIFYTDDQNDAVNLLIELRNNFTHFAPMSWSIDLLCLPNMTLRCVEIIILIQNDDWPFRHLEENKKAELNSNIEQIKTKCNQLHREYSRKWNR